MIVRKIISDYVLSHREEFPREDNQTQTEQVNDIDIESREYILNTLKNLKSKKKMLTIVVGNSNNHTGYLIISGKSEEVESAFGFIGLEGYKVLFKWPLHPNMDIYVDLRNRIIRFLDGTVLSVTTKKPYDPDNTKALISGSLTDIINKIKKQ
jgi:hypothetical protein